MAGAVKWGGEFAVSGLSLDNYDSRVASLGDGRFVVTWTQLDGGSDRQVMGRIVDATGAPLGAAFMINQADAGVQDASAVIGLANGGFAVTYFSATSILYRAYDASGAPVGDEVVLGTGTFSGIGASPSGQNPTAVFVEMDGTPDIARRIISYDTSTPGPVVQVNSTPTGSENTPAIAFNSTGQALVVWTHNDGSGALSINGRVLEPDGTPYGIADFQINVTATGQQSAPAVATLPGSNFPFDSYVVVWTDASGSDGSGSAIRAQRVSNGGALLGPEILVNTSTSGDQRDPSVKGLADGRWVVVWTDMGAGDGSGSAVRGQVFNADGSPSGAEFVANTVTTGSQSDPDIAVLPDGRFVVTWTTTSGVSGQIFDAREGGSSYLGTSRADELHASAFGDQLSGFGGDDTLVGAAGDDALSGGAGDDVLDGGSAGADAFNGGDGFDTVDFRAAVQGVVITNYDGNAGAASGDTFGLVEGFELTDHGDTLDLRNLDFTDGETVVANGYGGNDILIAYTEADILDGGEGDDVIFGGLSTPDGVTGLHDTYVGGDGIDILDLSTTLFGVVIYQAGSATFLLGTASHSGFEVFRLTSSSDTFHASAAGGVQVFGGGGDDVFFAGAGADSFNGEGGLMDQVRYLAATSAVSLNLATGVHGGWAAGDVLTGIEVHTLSNLNDTLVGSAGHDTVYGADGNDALSGAGDFDFLFGGNGSDVLSGGLGDDSLWGDAGSDDLFGNEGDDQLDGGAGADSLDGGDGDDAVTYASASARVVVDLESGFGLGDAQGDTYSSIEFFGLSDHDDLFIGSSGNDRAGGGEGDDILIGGDGNDQLFGHEGANELDGGAGDDLLWGGAASDNFIGGSGVDQVFFFNAATVNLTTGQHLGEASGDTYVGIERYQFGEDSDRFVGDATANHARGGGGVDNLKGEAGDDLLLGQDGDDQLSGGAGLDQIEGGDGDDVAFGGADSDLIVGGLGADFLRGDDGDDTVQGGDGDDMLRGDAGNDVLTAGAGADVVIGGAGDDIMDGGADIDTVSYAGAEAGVVVSLSQATAQNTVGAGLDTLAGFENLFGSSFDDTLSGTTGANVMAGGAGADTLNGALGADTLGGDTGDDILNGGAGDDALAGGSGADFLAGQADNDTLDGGGDNDSLQGGTGDDSLNGGLGDDILNGGDGADVLIGGGGVDTATYQGGTVGVTVNLATGVGAGGWAQGDTYSGVSNVRGTNKIDVITGNAGANALDGAGGNDVIDGGDGADVLTGSGGADTLTGGVGDDVLNGGTEADTLNGGAGADLLNGGSENDTLNGGADADQLVGGTGNDALNGQSGDDILTGGGGNDTLSGGSGTDQFIFRGAWNADTILDFTAGAASADVIDFSTAQFASFAAVLAATVDDGLGNCVITSGANTIKLNGVTKAQLHADDFVLTASSPGEAPKAVANVQWGDGADSVGPVVCPPAWGEGAEGAVPGLVDLAGVLGGHDPRDPRGPMAASISHDWIIPV